MKLKKSLLAVGAASAIGLASAAGVVSAAANTSARTDLVDKIAQRFSLNRDDVQKVFDENRATHEAEMQQNMQDRLTQAVKDGKITEDQKAKILAKADEMKTFMDTLKDKTAEERKTAMENKRNELEQWAKDNNIPIQYVRFLHGPRGHGMGRGHHGMMDDEDR